MASFPSADRLALLTNFGHSIGSVAYVYRPTHAEQIAELYRSAAGTGFTVGMRGAGRSYGDASLNGGHVALDLQRMNRILDWNPGTGVIRVEPGVTIGQLWAYTLEDGWWPPVVPGTMFPTLGGCLAMNIHGKNNYVAGPIGEHVAQFTALLPTGEEVACSPTQNADLFHSLIGGLGVLGVFTSITLQLKHIYSGNLKGYAWASPNLRQMMDEMESLKADSDYLVGWVDGTWGGSGLGRGQVHRAHYFAPGEDPSPAQSLRVEAQVLPDTFFGLVPKSILWQFMRFFMNTPGAWLTNTAKYVHARTLDHRHHFLQSLVAFNFLLDYVPNWEKSYGRGGLIQYQSFIPRAAAAEAFADLLKLTQRRGLPTYLGVLKRHRPDKFLLSHAVDGFSLAMDFKVTGGNRPALQRLTDDMSRIVLDAGGRFYFAKDSTLTREVVAESLGPDTLARFCAMKARCDPQSLLQTELYRRVFGSI
ncbi:MAG: FAD-binding oxidoreductase [Chloroflexi bacterium]|nr:FAD-binding oxidoreductase [Chloroflexota bacterium]